MKLYNSDYDSFFSYIKGKRLICYGAGKMLDEMAEEIPQLQDICKEIRIVDGDKKKTGSIRYIWGKEFIIENIEMLHKSINKENVILITSMAFVEIASILSEYLESGTPVFIFNLMRKVDRDSRLLFIDDTSEIVGKSETQQIPKIIHYFWFGRKPIPDEFKRNIDTWRKFCPDYKIIEWNEDNCDIDSCRYAAEAYRHGKYGFVPDYFRLKTIYEQGGIYLDVDVELLKPLDELLYLDAFACFEDNEHVAFGGGFGAKKGLPLLKEMYQIYEEESFIHFDGTFNLIASPVYQTSVLKKYGLICDGHMQIIEKMTILPMNFLIAKSGRTGKLYITDQTFSIHHYAATWFSDIDLKYKKQAEELLKVIETI